MAAFGFGRASYALVLAESWTASGEEFEMMFGVTRSGRKAAGSGRDAWCRTTILCAVFCFLVLSGRGQDAAKLSLHDAIMQAQAGPLGREGQDRVDVAHGLITGAALRPNPRLYLSSEDIQPWKSDFSFANNTEDYGYLAQLVELGGKRASRLGVARATYTQTEAERTLFFQQIAGRVAMAYWGAVSSQSVIALLEEDMQAVDRIVLYNKERVDAGATRGVDLLRAQIERDRLQLALETARRDAVLSRVELFKQMGREPQARIELTDTLFSSGPIPPRTIALILAGRADLAVAREAVNVAQANVRLQHSIGVADLDVLAGYKRNSGADTLYSAIQLPLAFHNRNQGEVERAQATVRLQQDHLLQLELAVRADVKAAQEGYVHQQQIVQVILPDMRARARKNLEIMDEAYRIGGVDLLRFLDAERTEFDIEVSALRTQSEFQQAAVRLQIAYGVQP